MPPRNRKELVRLMYALSEYRKFGEKRAGTLDAQDKRLLIAYLKAVGELEKSEAA